VAGGYVAVNAPLWRLSVSDVCGQLAPTTTVVETAAAASSPAVHVPVHGRSRTVVKRTSARRPAELLLPTVCQRTGRPVTAADAGGGSVIAIEAQCGVNHRSLRPSTTAHLAASHKRERERERGGGTRGEKRV